MIKLLESIEIVKDPKHKKCLVDLSKRYFFNGRDYYVDEERREVKLDRLLHHKLETKTLWKQYGFKKIGGSMVGDILETDRYKSEFVAFIKICRLDMPIIDKTHIIPGICLEPKLIDEASDYTKLPIKTFNAKEIGYDLFKDDEIMGGVPDGLFEDLNRVIEIKTAHLKYAWDWEEWGIPESYIKQAQHYAYLLNCDSFTVLIGFLEDKDYDKPWEVNLNYRLIKLFNFELDKKVAEDDYKFMKKWYLKHTESGISPRWPRNVSKDLLDYLKCKNQDEWNMLLIEWAISKKINFESLTKEIKIPRNKSTPICIHNPPCSSKKK